MLLVRKKLILASKSPRRQYLFRQLGLEFDVRESGVEEHFVEGMSPREYVERLSDQKARAVASEFDDAIVVGADTIVVLDGQVIEKPTDMDDAVRMLSSLSNQVHEVYTGFTILDCLSGRAVTSTELTSVKFRTLDPDEIEEYVRTGSPMDKAGAYGIQDDYGAVFVERIEGCFYNVVGFPLTKFYVAMRKFEEQLANV